MKSRNRFFYLFVLVALVIVSLGTTGSASAQGSSIVCIPTCSATDGRMLSLASIGFSTLAGQTINLRIAVPAAMATFEVGVFDGDTGGIWDSGSTPLVYTVYADPMNTGQVTEQVAQWTGDTLLDNDWSSTIINQDPRAMAPSGDYFYNMQIVLPNAGTVETASNFKIRSNAPVELALNESFAYMAVAFPKNLSIIYPQYPTLTPTTFDGTWDLYLNVPSSTSSLTVWDGDVDYGSYTCTTNDTDDPDTPNNVLPSWAIGISDVPEGVATSVTNKCKNAAGKVVTGPEGQIYTTGFPADDTYAPQFLRSPSVNYELTDAKGNTYSNPNPSGNLEWEQFRIDSDPNAPADYHVDGLLSAGLYHLRITGLDMNNLNAWHLTYNQVCIHEDGSPCVPILHPYKLGDTVWYDVNGNGVQDAGEAGIPGVTVTLLDGNGQPLPNGTAVTDANGNYFFSVDAGTYSVQVDASNFEAGGALAGYTSTTPGGNLQTNTVTTENILTYDFGYSFASLGDFVWKDLNGNGLQDSGEPGVAGITVNLLGSDGVTVVASTTTDANGSYSFTKLQPGTYSVQFVAQAGEAFTTANAGSDDAKDSDVDSAGRTAAITLSAGETNNSVDAGLIPPASIGDFVWNDLNSNGVQDSGEPGMAGVTVNLLGSDGASLLASTTTDVAGSYSFTDLLPGTYYVQFVAPAETTFTKANVGNDAKDSDANTSTGKTSAITLSIGEINNSVDAGLKESLSLSCPGNLVLNPSFEMNTGTPPKYWTNGTAGPINVPVVDGKNAAYINGSGVMYQRVNVIPGNSYTLTFYSGSHNPSIQTVKIQYFTSGGSAIGTASVHTITSDLEISGFGGPYSLTLDPAPSNAAYMKIMVSANNKDYAKVDKLCLQAGTPPATASIGDFVWNDLNSNGVQDSGEPGMAGVTVNLLGSDGASLLASTTTDVAGSYSFTGLQPGTYYVQFAAPAESSFTTANAGSDDTQDSDADAASGKTGPIVLVSGQTDSTVDAGLKSTIIQVNYCSYVRSPGFWKNYSNHMSDEAFLDLISHTQDFSYLTLEQALTILSTNNGATNIGISELDGVDASYLKFLLTSELNAAWNGQENAAAPGGMLGTGNYQGTGLTVNQVLHQAYLDRNNFSPDQKATLEYLGAGGENADQNACLVQS